MANRNIVTRALNNAALSATDYDQNLNGLHGSVDSVTTSTYTVLYTDQGKTIQLNHSLMLCTLDDLATIIANKHTDSFLVRLKNINAAACTINTEDSAQIDGNNSIQLTPYESVVLQINNAGTGWNVVSNSNKLRTLTLNTLGATANIIRDEDDMASDDASALATQQSIKAYVNRSATVLNIVKAEDGSALNGNTTLTNDPELNFVNIEPGDYRMEMFLRVLTNSTADFRWQFALFNQTGIYMYNRYDITADVTTSEYGLLNLPQSIDIVSGNAAIIHGIGQVNVSDSSNSFYLQWAQRVSTAVDTQLLAGSWVTLMKSSA